MNLSYRLQPKQILTIKQQLSPRLIQRLQTFGLSYIDLVEKIHSEAEENVFLEITQYDNLQPKKSKSDSTDFGFENIPDSGDQNLHSFLIKQLELMYWEPKEETVALALIDAIDDNGFIQNYTQLAKSLSEKHHISLPTILKILKQIQTFEPDGVGARSAKECLLIQLESMQLESDQLKQIIKNVIENHLEDVAEKNSQKIANALSISEEGVDAIFEFIKTNFNPYPAQGFQKHKIEEVAVPSFEAWLDEEETIHIVNLEKEKGIQVTLPSHYEKYLNDPKLDEQTKTYVKEKFESAKQLIETLQDRQEQLQLLVNLICNKQKPFLKGGPLFMIPLLQKDLATNIGFSPSSISRILSSKYIQTPHGLFLMKQFCPRGFQGYTKPKLQQLISKLSKDYPNLSDQKLAKKLEELGLKIARRTVTKYRHLEGVKSHYDRNK